MGYDVLDVSVPVNYIDWLANLMAAIADKAHGAFSN